MMRLLIFGTGNVAEMVMRGMDVILKYVEIVGFVDNDDTKYGQTFHDRTIYHPGQLESLQYDRICILLESSFENVYGQLVYGYRISPEIIMNREDLLKYLMIEKHKYTSDSGIQDTLKYWEENPISYFNQHQYVGAVYDRIFWDKDSNMPYTVYKGKKLYYPRTYAGFIYKDRFIYAETYREMEQAALSPHRYLTDRIQIKKGDGVVDAGAREGEFALGYIDDIEHLFLFESDPEWVKALQATYREYGDKVSIISRMLGNCVNDTMTTLDETIGERRVDFLKMDIEGWECDALMAGRRVLEKNDMRCAVCSYHRKGDDEKLKNIFEECGYMTSYSNGYMIFLADNDIFKELDFRRAMVYARKTGD